MANPNLKALEADLAKKKAAWEKAVKELGRQTEIHKRNLADLKKSGQGSPDKYRIVGAYMPERFDGPDRVLRTFKNKERDAYWAYREAQRKIERQNVMSRFEGGQAQVRDQMRRKR